MLGKHLCNVMEDKNENIKKLNQAISTKDTLVDIKKIFIKDAFPRFKREKVSIQWESEINTFSKSKNRASHHKHTVIQMDEYEVNLYFKN